MTPMDIFDSMLESIQQFPLECNNFERRIKRLDKDESKYSKSLRRMLLKLVPLEDSKLLKTKTKLKGTLKKKITTVRNFKAVVERQMHKLVELVNISNLDTLSFNFKPLEGSVNMVVKVGDQPQGTGKYCVCNDQAYGQMICCSNPSCSVRWHHFKCAGLSTVPKLQWKCSKCTSTIN